MSKGKLYDRVQAYEDDGLIDEVSAICKVLDEAKREVPLYPYNSTDVEGDMIDYGNSCKEWFKKYLGDE